MGRIIFLSILVFSSLSSFASLDYCKAPLEFHGENAGYKTLAIEMSKRCEIYDQCVLTCIRAHCAADIGGGCGHMCSQLNYKGESREKVLSRAIKTYHQREQNGGCEENEI